MRVGEGHYSFSMIVKKNVEIILGSAVEECSIYSPKADFSLGGVGRVITAARYWRRDSCDAF
jgi:hypothetical protein